MTSLSARVAAGDQPRELQEITLLLIDGSQIRGVLHRTPGTRTLDYLNRQTDAFVAMTEAVIATVDGRETRAPFVAINKLQIVRVIEGLDPEPDLE
jgi:hypothetical protein